MVDQKKLALMMGILIGGLHLVWTVCIGIMPGIVQWYLNRILGLHMLQPYLIITQFNFSKMIILVLLTFIVGGIFGRIMGYILNSVMKKKK